jgi:malate dehydrogenase (oxaloacetate-decarboxylating)
LSGNLQENMQNFDVFIGLAKPNLINTEDVKKMKKDPIIFSLANPTPEIMPEDAKKGGAKVVGTGRSDFPNQLNNSLIFPGLFKGVLDNNIKQFETEMFVRAAHALASHVKEPTREMILPTMFDKELVGVIAKSVKD